MKRIALAAVAALCLAMLGATATAQTPPRQHTPTDARCTVGAFRDFSAAVWHPSKWDRAAVPARVRAAQRARLACAPPGHRAAMKRTWRRDHAAWSTRRRIEQHRERWTPYYGCTKLGVCKWWALPAYIVSCESGGDYTPDAGLTFGGAYGLLVETWLQWGGGRYAPAANLAPPWAQDRIARQVWLDVGPGGWACA